jgi:8-oxo-dGTP pyrophosphatase MutT (NUDIX family)
MAYESRELGFPVRVEGSFARAWEDRIAVESIVAGRLTMQSAIPQAAHAPGALECDNAFRVTSSAGRLSAAEGVAFRIAPIGAAASMDDSDGSDRRQTHEQAGAIPWRWNGRGPEVLLITSSRGDRWIVPKGRIAPGSSPAQCAVEEAFEEAGVRGVLSSHEPFGVFGFKRGKRELAIVVFLLEVLHVHERWPDEKRRRRAWLSPEQAAGMVRDSGLRELISTVPECLVGM